MTCPLCGTPHCQALPPLAKPHRQDWHCAVCDLRFLENTLHVNATAEKARYLQHHNHPEDTRYQAFLQPLCTGVAARLPPGAVGLDFGCGQTSTLTPMLQTCGFEITGYDPFFHPEKKALDATYDFIVASEVVEHFCAPAVAFGQLHRLLKPGGWLGLMTALVTPNLDFTTWHYRRDPTHVAFYSAKTFAWISGNFGLKLDEITPPRVIFLQKHA